MMKDIKVTASIKHGDIKASGKVGFIRDIDTSEPYTGSYDVTVVNTQVLPTKDKRMTSNLTVRQGAETYTGATEVSVRDTDVVINTANKLVPSNITLKQGFPRYRGPYSLNLTNPGVHHLLVDGKFCDEDIHITQPYTHYSGPMTFTVVNEDITQVFANEWINGVMFIKQGITGYDGQTNVTVTDTPITLATNGKRLASDITINQGITAYTGATSFSVADSNITIPTSGKRLTSNITIDISDLETLATQISEVVG